MNVVLIKMQFNYPGFPDLLNFLLNRAEFPRRLRLFAILANRLLSRALRFGGSIRVTLFHASLCDFKKAGDIPPCSRRRRRLRGGRRRRRRLLSLPRRSL